MIASEDASRGRGQLALELRMPPDQRFDTFVAAPVAALAQLRALAQGGSRESFYVEGAHGTGKSHLLIGLGTAAAEHGYRVRYVTAAALVNELAEAADDRILGKVIARYGRIDLLCLDELGYIELDRRGAELLFQVFTEREEKNSIAIASNAAFSEWAQAFTGPRLCAAIVDRLTYDAHIITTGTGSYRLKSTAARRGAMPAGKNGKESTEKGTPS